MRRPQKDVIEFMRQHPAQGAAQRRIASPAAGRELDFGQQSAYLVAAYLTVRKNLAGSHGR